MPENSTPDTKSTKDVLIARADEQLSHVHEQLAQADEELARVTEQLAKMERGDAKGGPSEPAPPPSRGKPARRGVIGIGLLAAACFLGVVVAALVRPSSLDHVKLGVTGWAPRLVATSSLPPEKPPLSVQPDTPSVQLTAAEDVTTQTAPSTQPPPHDTAPTATADAPTTAAGAPTAAGNDSGLSQSLQTMAGNLTKMEQSIAELKAKQDQMASDYAKAIEQLKAKQEDITRRIANVSAQNAALRASPPRSTPPRRARGRERPLTPPVYWDYYDEPW